jgi:hypothetical protein
MLGRTYRIAFSLGRKRRALILKILKPVHGQTHLGERSLKVFLAHSGYKTLPKHVGSVDAVAVMLNNELVSLKDAQDFVFLMEEATGTKYSRDIEAINRRGRLLARDLTRARVLSRYLAQIHRTKEDNPAAYFHRIRKTFFGSEGIAGIIDSYPERFLRANIQTLRRIERQLVEWRWRLRNFCGRLSVVHGDIYPENVFFRPNNDFVLLDRDRGELGDPADDISSLTINYILPSVVRYGVLRDPFRTLFNTFMTDYFSRTEDNDLYTVIAPFYTFRVAVICNPRIHPELDSQARKVLFNFASNLLSSERFDYGNINSYFAPTQS